MADKLGMSQDGEIMRHPLALLVEAADDIAYLLSDMQDALKMNLISYEEGLELFNIILPARPAISERLSSIPEDMHQDRLQFITSAVMVEIVKSCSISYVQNINTIMNGTFGRSLLSSSDDKYVKFEQKAREINKSSIWTQAAKLRDEAGAFERMHYLMDVFSAVGEEYLSANKDPSMLTERNRNLFALLTKQETTNIGMEPYDVYQHVVDFVAGMTDRYATNLYHSLRGDRLSMR